MFLRAFHRPVGDARVRRTLSSALASLLLAGTLLSPIAAGAAAPAQQADPRTFPVTGYRVDRESFWDFFQKRGGLRTFGYPVSRELTFQGCSTQFFQRVIMQECGAGGVGTLNLLDAGLLPYTRINGSTFPASDSVITGRAPSPRDPDYGAKVLDFIRQTAPDEFEGDAVNFFSTFQNTVTLDDAFPQGGGDPNLLPLLNLELWGLPTSAPMRDPNNGNFVYQRFQRGIMHFDRSTGATQGLLLADYLKAVIMGENLPPDLAAQAAGSPLFRSAVAGADAQSLTNAFTPLGQTPIARPSTPLPPPPAPTAQPLPRPTAQPAPTAVPAPVTVVAAAPSPDYGLSMFLWGQSSTTARDIKLAQDAKFTWQKTLFQWRLIEGRCKGCFDWTEADRVVKASNDANIKVLARMDFQPGWTGVPENLNGPPNNYQDFYDFVTAFVSRYKQGSPAGRVHAIEIWNEVNLSREWGDRPIGRQQAADYVRLLSGAYRAAKAADPGVTVITAGLSPTGVKTDQAWDDQEYLQFMYDAGMKGGVNYDVLGAHGNTQAPEVDVALNGLPTFPHPSFYFRRVEQLREVQVKNGDADRQIWLLEFGWTSDKIHPAYSWFSVDEEKKAQNVVRAYQFARERWTPWIGVMVLWTFSDPFWTSQREEYWWAITNPDGSARPAYNRIRDARQSGLLP